MENQARNFYSLDPINAKAHCMFSLVMNLFDRTPRRVFAAIAIVCVGLLGFAMYLQQVGGLEPCPMCIVQRYADVLIVLVATLGALLPRRGGQLACAGGLLLLALAGAFVAARQSFLQWYPPEVVSCGRDLYGMIENFPLKRVFPMIFRGSGDCSKVDWTFLGGSIANWSFVWFVVVGVTASTVLARQSGSSRRR